MLDGAALKDLESHDPGREFIYPFLQKQALLQNCPVEGQHFAFPVFDGFPVQMKQVNIFSVGDAERGPGLSSDGYLDLYSTLRDSSYFRYSGEYSLCMRLYKSTKRSAKRQLLF